MKAMSWLWAGVGWAMGAIAAAPATGDATTAGIAARVRDVDGDGVIRVACVGDSITAGNPRHNYPKCLQRCLDELGKVDLRRYVVTNHGKGGAACRHVREKVDVDGDGVKNDYFYYDDRSYRSSLGYTPDVVIVQMGTNDALFDNWANWTRYFDADYAEYLVKPYRDKGALVVLSTPPYACNGWHNENVNGPVHEREVALARKLGLPIVDTNRLLWGKNEVFEDGLHGNETGYELMAQNFYQHVFGGKLDTLTVKAEPGTRIMLKGGGRNFCCVARERARAAVERRPYREGGTATMTLLPGEHEFELVAEKEGFKRECRRVEFSGSYTLDLRQRPGDFNLARRGRAIDCGVPVWENRLSSSSLADGERDKKGYQPARWHAGDWCGIELDGEREVHTVVVYWESAQFVAPYAKGGYEVWFKRGGEWQKSSGLKVVREAYAGAVVVDRVPVAGRIAGVKLVFGDGGCSHQYAPKVYEIEILSDSKN